jgi:hypothetical protein
VDNAGPDDLILIDFGAGHQYSGVTFSIGWENSSPCTDIAVAAGCPDIDIWIGNSWLPPNRWNSIEGASDWMRILTAGTDIQPSTTGNAHYYDLDGSVTGQYLVIAGQRLSGNNDYFTLQSLVLDRQAVPDPSTTVLDLHAVPEPNATALAGLALGLGLLMATRRRRR